MLASIIGFTRALAVMFDFAPIGGAGPRSLCTL
jgi:hypothetical protein